MKFVNVPGDIETEPLENIERRIVNTALDKKPTMDEMVRVVNNFSNRLHGWIIKIWEEGHVPQASHDANIVTIYNKGGRTECGNYRCISVLSAAGKIFARILLNRLSSHITPEVVPETQVAFIQTKAQ